jgi:hypothetical protein
MTLAPLSTPLSQLLIAFTIELDNEFERRLTEAGGGARVASVVMWSNFLRFVGEGITVAELPVAAGLPKPRVLSTLGGMERWRYVSVDPVGNANRDGYGSARGLRGDWVVRPRPPGERAQQIWPPLFGEIETRWQQRFGTKPVEELRGALAALVDRLDFGLPEYLPVVVGQAGLKAEISPGERRDAPPHQLLALLAQVLLAYTLDFERASDISLPLAANVLRVLDERAIDIRELPVAAAVSPEAIAMALTVLRKGYVTQEAKSVRLTATGRKARDSTPELHEQVARGWETRFGRASVEGLRAAMNALLDQREGARPMLALGLEPYDTGWRASTKYLRHTEAMLEDPFAGLPQHPMVLHRGGWPDGS